jgi:hypothetical protein
VDDQRRTERMLDDARRARDEALSRRLESKDPRAIDGVVDQLQGRLERLHSELPPGPSPSGALTNDDLRRSERLYADALRARDESLGRLLRGGDPAARRQAVAQLEQRQARLRARLDALPPHARFQPGQGYLQDDLRRVEDLLSLVRGAGR